MNVADSASNGEVVAPRRRRAGSAEVKSETEDGSGRRALSDEARRPNTSRLGAGPSARIRRVGVRGANQSSPRRAGHRGRHARVRSARGRRRRWVLGGGSGRRSATRRAGRMGWAGLGWRCFATCETTTGTGSGDAGTPTSGLSAVMEPAVVGAARGAWARGSRGDECRAFVPA